MLCYNEYSARYYPPGWFVKEACSRGCGVGRPIQPRNGGGNGRLTGGVPGVNELTKRQREVLELCQLGYTSIEIAAALGISYRTVENHITEIIYKTGVGHKKELVRYNETKGHKNNNYSGYIFIINSGRVGLGDCVSVSFNPAEYTDPSIFAFAYGGTRCGNSDPAGEGASGNTNA